MPAPRRVGGRTPTRYPGRPVRDTTGRKAPPNRSPGRTAHRRPRRSPLPLGAAGVTEPPGAPARCTFAPGVAPGEGCVVAERTVIDDRYELEPVPIGEGGMGEVYRAYDRRLDRRVAVKIIRFPFGQHDETLVKRFLHESRVMARLEHPGTPAIHDVGVFDDPRVGSRPFMVMQFVEGIALDYIV